MLSLIILLNEVFKEKVDNLPCFVIRLSLA